MTETNVYYDERKKVDFDECSKVGALLLRLMGHFPNHITIIEGDWTNRMIESLLHDLMEMRNRSCETLRKAVKEYDAQLFVLKKKLGFEQEDCCDSDECTHDKPHAFTILEETIAEGEE